KKAQVRKPAWPVRPASPEKRERFSFHLSRFGGGQDGSDAVGLVFYFVDKLARGGFAAPGFVRGARPGSADPGDAAAGCGGGRPARSGKRPRRSGAGRSAARAAAGRERCSRKRRIDRTHAAAQRSDGSTAKLHSRQRRVFFDAREGIRSG